MWLETNGNHFLEPLPGSTNYLGAYDPKSGRLKRLVADASEDGSGNPQQENSAKDGVGHDQPLPPETSSDLIPFPLNRAFRSQSVVNEAMREDIWKKVMVEGQSVRTVSAELGVEMSRVGAIVRLKEIEKEWVRKVSVFSNEPATGTLCAKNGVMIITENRLVFKTSTWLPKFACEPL